MRSGRWWSRCCHRGGRGWGRPLTHPRREIVNAILYVARAGCSWRQLPGDLPPWATVYDYFAVWTADGIVDRIHDRLRDAVRDEAGRDPMTSAGSVDSQSVKGADTVGAGSRGMTPERRSTVESVTSWSTLSGCCWWC
jgi:transposase